MPHPDWSSLELYVMEEHIEDYNLGFIGRRELLRKVTLITGSLAITLAVLPALGCNPAPTGTGASPAAGSAANRTPSPTAVATAASTDFAIPPAARTTDGITVKADDPRIVAAAAQPKGAADGFAMTGYLARCRLPTGQRLASRFGIPARPASRRARRRWGRALDDGAAVEV